jgi:hypothetical protein
MGEAGDTSSSRQQARRRRDTSITWKMKTLLASSGDFVDGCNHID